MCFAGNHVVCVACSNNLLGVVFADCRFLLVLSVLSLGFFVGFVRVRS